MCVYVCEILQVWLMLLPQERLKGEKFDSMFIVSPPKIARAIFNCKFPHHLWNSLAKRV